MAETTQRILSLLSLLQTHRRWSGPELARRLDVTPRTLRRDVDRLRDLGYRIEAERGVAGGYRLEAGERMPPLLLSDDEAVAVAIGLRVAASQGLVDGEETTLSALAKFEQVLPPALRERVNALGRLVAVGSPRERSVPAELLGQLALACRDRERIRFHYTARGGAESDRIVEPATLVAADRAWYLVAWDVRREDWRTFRADRISHFFATRLTFAERTLPVGDAAEFVRRSLSSAYVSPAAEPAAAVLSLPLERALEWFGPWAGDLEELDAGTVRWRIPADTTESMLGALAWIPDGVAYRLEGSQAFLEAAGAHAARLSRALPTGREADGDRAVD
jgi:predicted DNA-binding transcriptional regulator YafY